jgi:hypothetical protein
LAALAFAFATINHVDALDMQQLTRETQRTTQNSGEVTLVWWMAQPLWEAGFNSNSMLTPQGRAQALAILDDYLIFAIIRAKLGVGGIIDVRTKADMVSHSRLEVDGKSIEPISPENLTPAAQAMLVSIKPMFASMLGKFGQGLEIVVYPSMQDGRRLIDPLKAGSFRYTLYDQTFSWRLPLASVLPPKIDAKTGDEYPGDYQFNPYTGEPLIDKRPSP